ncbi:MULTISPECIES: hypothetical protein [unclassified Acinetobacter]|uniref:hypothetical protein n=1 Tax=unclassified Acinetobacter TaxID=196816 RepID=UPI0029349A68|nr:MULTISPECIES: hypothetical protein [unclassified Acinetobacter]WOE32908.1 hypothetical protein QSG84_07045 [Acinetobacter sp. SAAs470]WOE38385.1 hypothetical protein QSG86_16100 [Acinetobacter sp. SAAs474]
MKLVNIICLLSTLLLASCIPIRVVPKYNPDTYNGYKVIQAYQKKESIGHTDVEQRKRDVFECGVRNYNAGNLDLSAQFPDMKDEDIIPRRISIDNCMKKKGYIISNYESCTLKGKPTGFCN